MFTKLLVPLDNSPLAEQALPAAQSLARSEGASIELVYVHQPQPYGGYDDAPWNAARRSSEESYVCAIADEIRIGTSIQIHGGLATGPAADAICARAQFTGADLIVMTTHGRTGINRAWLGSVADGVIRQASVPVLLLRAAAVQTNARVKRSPFKRVLVPLDGSPASALIAAPALALAKADGGRLIIVEIVPPIPLVLPDITLSYGMGPTIPDAEATEAVVREASARLHATAATLSASGVTVETHVVVSEFPARAILDATRRHAADVIAMTTSGRGASRLAVGSVTDKVMRATELPLLMYRPTSVEMAARPEPAFTEALSLASA